MNSPIENKPNDLIKLGREALKHAVIIKRAYNALGDQEAATRQHQEVREVARELRRLRKWTKENQL